jgi:hypothetical protein
MRFRESDAFTKAAARTSRRRFDDGHRAVVLLHDDLDTLLDSGQHSMDVAGELSFCNADCHVFSDHSGYSFTLARRWGLFHFRNKTGKKEIKQKRLGMSMEG